MKKIKVLKKVHKGKMTAEKAYRLLYEPIEQLPKAHFVKIKLTLLKKGWLLNMLFALLFLLPLGVWFVKWVIKKGLEHNNQTGMPVDEIISMIEKKGLDLTVVNSEIKFRVHNF